MDTQATMPHRGIEGALLVLSPLPLLFLCMEKTSSEFSSWQLLLSLCAGAACFFCALTIIRKPLAGKLCAFLALGGSYGAALPYIADNPFIALAATTLLIGLGFFFLDFSVEQKHPPRRQRRDRSFQRAWWGLLMVPALLLWNVLLGTAASYLSSYVIAASFLTAQALLLYWALQNRSKKNLLLVLGSMVSLGVAFLIPHPRSVPGFTLFASAACLLVLSRNGGFSSKKEPWWDTVLNHPARMLLISFLGLCLAGTFLLLLPPSTRSGTLNLVDAAFTSVSAVCVTGLIVLDTPQDFTLFGQCAILLLIQLGGLGIMSITTVALHAMGRRFSLKQERLLISMTDTDHRGLLGSLGIILKFTLAAESLGAILLWGAFFLGGEPFFQALWRGIFTAVSAFCNAGFSLQSDSLISYNGNFFILHVVGALIISGGLAPATSLLVPRWLAGKPIPLHARIALVTTLILLLSGTLFILVFEWSGILEGLSWGAKIHNAWFQSVTLRTAGFNSVDITHIGGPTFLVMILFMFIGGSPGGTAGGIKTTTLGVLALTFRANVTGKNEIVVRNRRIRGSTVFRAITILFAGALLWIIIVTMLETTQQILSRDLIFEATSALGTVGLSTGATALLDEIGKVIVILAMFAGRIGPMTFFMLLREEQPSSGSSCPDAKISLT